MPINPPIKFDINEFTQVVGDGKHIIMKSTERLQTLSDEEAMTMGEALIALVKTRRSEASV